MFSVRATAGALGRAITGTTVTLGPRSGAAAAGMVAHGHQNDEYGWIVERYGEMIDNEEYGDTNRAHHCLLQRVWQSTRITAMPSLPTTTRTRRLTSRSPPSL